MTVFVSRVVTEIERVWILNFDEQGAGNDEQGAGYNETTNFYNKTRIARRRNMVGNFVACIGETDSRLCLVSPI